MATFHSIQPVPLSYHAGSTGRWLFTLWAGGFALAVLPYVFWRLAKFRDYVPILMWLGGLICSFGEPMLDRLGHLWWPLNLPGPAFKGYDLSVPLLIPGCYAFFASGMGYIAYRYFTKGITMRQVWILWLCLASTDLALELPGVGANVYKYYGREPFYAFNFPLHWVWMNGTAMMLIGFLAYVLVPRLKGWRQLWVLAITVSGFLGSYGIVGWPAFMSLNFKMSSGMQHIVDLGSLVLCLGVIRVIAEVVATREKDVTVTPWVARDGRAAEPETAVTA